MTEKKVIEELKEKKEKPNLENLNWDCEEVYVKELS